MIDTYLLELYWYLRNDYQTDESHKTIRVLQFIQRNPGASIKDVAMFMDISHNTASLNIKKMITKNYITKMKSESDERVVHLTLTDIGNQIVDEHTRLNDQKLAKVYEIMSPEERIQIEEALKRLKEVCECVI